MLGGCGWGVMHPWDGVPAGLEETGAKAGAVGPGLSLLQQVGCWPFSLSSWVSNCSPASPLPLLFLTPEGFDRFLFWCRWGGVSRFNERWSSYFFSLKLNGLI